MALEMVLNGETVAVATARISPLDRGFLFGDGVYEVVRVRGGLTLFLARHLERLRASLAAVAIPEPAGIEAGCRAVLAATGLREGSLYIQVTRGAGTRHHLPAPDMTPTWIILPSDQAPLRPGERPMSAVSWGDPRWQRCDIKTVSLMGTVLGKLQARQAAADEVLFVGPDGAVREGGSTSLFVRRRDRLETHPLDGRILPSITRERVLGLCRAERLPFEQTAPRLDQRQDWDEAFLCGTLTGLQPLVMLDGRAVAGAEAGEWTARLAAALQDDEDRTVAQRGGSAP